jgi:divalent metal cation (Fe/Co/Zn/Cd) transporter
MNFPAPAHLKPPKQAHSDWWGFNLRLVSLGVCIWLLLTLLGALAAGDSAVSSLQFLISAQWIPVLYWVLVVAYCVAVNSWMVRAAGHQGKAIDSPAHGDRVNTG